MDNQAKLRPLYLFGILKERTDEEHYLSTSQLCSILKDEYGMETHRTTVKSDIEALRSFGIDIQVTRSTQNRYNFIGREFDNAELKLLIDAVESSKFITKVKSEQLVSKLISLAGVNKAREMKRNLVVDGRYKLENEQVYYIADAINDAINRRKKIAFQKIEYNVKKERVLRHGGEVYTFSPYSLVWDGDFYYVVGYSDKYQNIGSHRVDRIYKQPEILEEAGVPAPSGFDINKFINTMFRMYNAPRKEIELICENAAMDAVIDKFGLDAPVQPFDSQNFKVDAEVAIGPAFFNWVFGFQGKVKIEAPDDVKRQYKKMLRKALRTL